MKTVTAKQPASVPAMVLALVKELAKKAPKLLTPSVNIALGVVAFVAVMLYQATGDHPKLMAATVMAWTLHLATLATIDIAKGGASKL